MDMKVFTVFDSAVGAYLQPFFMRSKGEAIRGFGELVNDKTHQFGKYPADYQLFEIGSFDQWKCEFKSHPAPLNLGNGLEFVVNVPLEVKGAGEVSPGRASSVAAG